MMKRTAAAFLALCLSVSLLSQPAVYAAQTESESTVSEEETAAEFSQEDAADSADSQTEPISTDAEESNDTAAVAASDSSEALSSTLTDAVVTNNISDNNYSVWASSVCSYLMENEDGSCTRVEYVSDTGVVVEVYASDWTLTSTLTLEAELSLFGGFYSGETYNFLVFGQTNYDEDDEVEVIRVVKYSKDWERLGSCSIYGANTYSPFSYGSLRMTETNGDLYIRSCHTMYASSDGLNHQANMTFVIDQEEMTVEDSSYDIAYNIYGYVSHSFNQFIQTDGSYIYLVDHGDAYPRSICLSKAVVGSFGSSVFYDTTHSIYSINGTTGANATGVSIGGFELSDDNCLVVGNSVDMSDEDGYSASGQRNIFLLVTDQNITSTSTIWLTDYTSDDGITPRTPQMVKINSDTFLIMWEEYASSSKTCTTRMVLADADGNLFTDIVTSDARLSDCQPILTSDGLVKWYVTNGSSAVLYQVNPYSLLSYQNLDYASVSLEYESATYTGAALEPAVTVQVGGSILTEGVDYTVSYENNTNAGTATVTVTACGNHSGGWTSTFEIEKKQITDLTDLLEELEPEPGSSMETAVDSPEGYTGTISWEPADSVYDYATEYSVVVTLECDSNHAFADSVSVPEGWTYDLDGDGVLTLTCAYDATKTGVITSIEAPGNQTLDDWCEDADAAADALPDTVSVTTEDGVAMQLDITWSCMGTYDSTPSGTNSFTWAITSEELARYTYEASSVSVSGTVTVTNAAWKNAIITASDSSVVYAGEAVDISTLFEVDGAGTVSYSMTEGTGEGTLNGSALTLTKAGTFTITISTAADQGYYAGTASAVLTVEKGTGSGSVSIYDWISGEDASEPVPVSETNGTDAVTYLYETAVSDSDDAETETYSSSEAPTDAGDYTLTVTFAETDLYESCSASADFTVLEAPSTYSCGSNLTWSLDIPGGTLTISGTGSMKNYTSSSLAPWYSYASYITEAVIESGATGIGNRAFYGLSSMTEVSVPDTVTSIGSYAFRGCSDLTEITIPDTVTSLGSYAFYSCTALTGISIPDGVSSVGNYTFYNCGALTDVQLPASLTSIGTCAFSSCYALETISIPEGVTAIGSSAFYYCKSLSEIIIPESVTSIGSYAFADCTKLANIILPEGLTSIGSYTFSYCRSLAALAIPDSVTSIGNYAFYSCTALTGISVPENVTSIGNYAFYSCTNLSSVSFEGDVPETVSATAFYGRSFTAYYPSGNETWTEDVMTSDFGGAKSVTWEAYTPKNLKNAQITLAEESCIYDGTQKTPAISVTFDGTVLTEGTDYTVTYLNNVDAGTGRIVAVGCGSCSGTIRTTFTIERAEISDVSDLSARISAPEAAAEVQTGITLDSGALYSASLSWDTDETTFDYNTAYTAAVILTPDSNYTFTENTAVPSGWDSSVDENGVLTLTYTYPVTEKLALISVSAPSDTELAAYCADADAVIAQLPETISYTSAIDTTVTVDLTWSCEDYDPTPDAENSFTWSADTDVIENYDYGNLAVSGTITVTNADPIAVLHTGTNVTVTYSGSVIDLKVLSLFTLDANAGTASYSVAAGTGTGTFDADALELTVIKAGTFTVTVETAAAGAYAAGSASAVLTVEKGTGSGSVSISSWTYGDEAPSPVVSSETNGTDAVTYLYESTDDGGYSSAEAPTAPGEYKLTVTFAETDLYEACGAETAFTIASLILTGSCGDDVTYTLDVYEGVLTISGSGDMADYTSADAVPWADYADEITEIIISEGVTSIGDYAFSGLCNLEKVTIADSVTSIGGYAFGGCSSLESVEIPESVASIGESAFENCESLTDVWFCGDAPEISEEAFSGDEVTVYYPSGNDTWTEDVLAALGNAVTAETYVVYDLKYAEVSIEDVSLTYSGAAQEPAVTVIFGGESLDEGTDYTVSYSDNTNVGTAKVTVTGTGNYTGTAEGTFTIAEQTLSSSNVTLSFTSKTYTGSAFSPTVAVKNAAGETLTKGTDYTVSTPSGRKNAGTYTYKITGTGNYTGTVSKTLTIKTVSIKTSSSAYVSCSLSATSYQYNGSKKSPSVTLKVKVNGKTKTLTKNTDYSVAYSSSTRKAIGKYTVTIKGTGNYSGTITKTFKILPKKMSVKSAKSSSKKKLTVKWTKISGSITKYQIRYRVKGTSAWKTKTVSSSKSSYTLSGLKSGKTYQIQIRAYRTVSGTKYYGKWSSTKAAKVK